MGLGVGLGVGLRQSGDGLEVVTDGLDFPAALATGPDGAIYQTYNVQGRGQDIVNAAYNLLDFTAKGRDEDGLPRTMSWVRYHDEYPSA